MSKLANIAYEKGLTGLEFACGIPGSMGGAIKMNAGAYGREIKDVIVSTTYLDKNLELHTITKRKMSSAIEVADFLIKKKI